MSYVGADIRGAFVEGEREEYAPVAAGLRDLVPAPADPDLSRLEAEATRHRRLLIRTGAVIAVSTVISVGGALLFHMCLAGMVALGWWYSPTAVTGGGHALVGAPDSGGSPGGFMVLGDGPDDNAPPSAEMPTVARVMATNGAVNAPELPPLPETPAALRATEMTSPLMPALPSMGLGTVQLSAGKSDPVAPNSPPGTNEGALGAGGAGPRGTGAGDGGGDDDRPLGLFRGDGTGGRGGGGRGRGTGSGRGNGIDRGMSAADRRAQPLNIGAGGLKFSLPLKYQAKPPEKSVGLVLTIAADGTISNARIEQSCGISEVDQLVRDWAMASFQFSPARQGGKAIADEFHFELSFGPLD